MGFTFDVRVVDFHSFTVASELGRGIVVKFEEIPQVEHVEYINVIVDVQLSIAGYVQLAREQAEKAAGLPLSGASQPAVAALAASEKPPVSVAPALSQSGVASTFASTTMPTLPVSSTTTENAKLQ